MIVSGSEHALDITVRVLLDPEIRYGWKSLAVPCNARFSQPLAAGSFLFQ